MDRLPQRSSFGNKLGQTVCPVQSQHDSRLLQSRGAIETQSNLGDRDKQANKQWNQKKTVFFSKSHEDDETQGSHQRIQWDWGGRAQLSNLRSEWSHWTIAWAFLTRRGTRNIYATQSSWTIDIVGSQSRLRKQWKVRSSLFHVNIKHIWCA